MTRPNVSYCVEQNEVHYNPIPHDYSRDYFTFVALEDGTFTFTPENNNVISYSTDGGENWIEGNSVEVSNGDKVMWKGEMTPSSYKGVGKYSSTGQFDVQGNAMSLLFGDNFKEQEDLSGKNYAFYTLFNKNTKLINAENIVLPATTLASSCYYSMFSGCTNLTTTPSKLTATTLAIRCYSFMFNGCTSLTTAPQLPATTLANNCYHSMFNGCTSLVSVPALAATTLVKECYQSMFQGCTSLVTAPELPATTLAERCYDNMFTGCINLVTIPKLSATTLVKECCRYMFRGCTSLVNIPSVLPATTLASSCYYNMFYGCTSLTTAPELPATTLASSCYGGMFYGCTNLTSITCLATDISATNCTKDWVYRIASSGTFVKAANMTSWTTGNSGIPSGWTVQDAL